MPDLARANAEPAHAAAAPCVPSGVGKDSFCTADGLRLHYVDWGGRGPVVILLTGLGDSARIYDDFAPLLARGHRVLAFTRRGYGQSQTPADNNYSNAALVADVLGLMDALSIPRASFVGHSIAGGELASLGAQHPDRVDRMVYIDAAYDRSRVSDIMAHLPALPARLPSKTGSEVERAVLAGDIASPPKWRSIAAPSFAFYTSKDILDQVPPDATDAQKAAFLSYSLRVIRPWMLRAQADFLEQARCGVAVEVPHSTHYLFLERPEWTAGKILEFLAAGDPCGVGSDKLRP